MARYLRARLSRAGWLALLPVLLLAGTTTAQTVAGQGSTPSAWDELQRRDPAAADEPSLDPLTRRVLDVLTPGQAEALAGGAAPEEIVLESGETLAEYLTRSFVPGTGLVYEPVDQCVVFATAAQTAPVTGQMAADEIREFVVRGSGTALTDQGGAFTCMIPDEAVAVVMHFRVVAMTVQNARGLLKVWAADAPEPVTRVVEYEPIVDPPLADRFRRAGAAVVELCPFGGCAGGEIKVKTALLGGHVRGDVAGFFRPTVAADVPEAGNVQTLGGMDKSAFAAATHTHDGGDITSGTVAEPFIDSLLARDSEVFGILLAGAGPGSGVDLDTLDGLQASELRPRPANVVTVSPAGGDFASIQAALDAIGTSLPPASSADRYLVKVGPGVYGEQVTMKPFVDIAGSGAKVTRISAASQSDVGGPEGTLECASDAELRQLTVESTGGGEKAIAIRCLGTAPMLTHVKAIAMGATGGAAPENIGVLNDGAGAMPMLTQVAVYAGNTIATSFGVRNQNGAMPTIRDSKLAGSDAAIQNRDSATAKIANTELAGDAHPEAPAVQASFMCVRVYEPGPPLKPLNAECSPNTPPTASDDVYATLGNTLLEISLDHAGAASADNTTISQPAVIGETITPKTFRSVFENDTDAETADKNLLTAALVGGSVTAGAVVDMFDDGTFEYTPPVGFTGADTFDYTVTDPGGLSDTGTVTVDVSSLIWYVDKDNGGTADGRSTNPYTSLAPIDAGGADDGLDGAGDTIFVFDETTGTTGDGILLETDQILHGNGIALAPADFEYAGGGNLVAAGTRPSLGSAGDVVELASGNTVRGIDIAATNGRAIFANGSAAGTITQVGITGTSSGLGIVLDSATGSFTFTDLDVNSSTGAGIDIQGGSGSFTFDSASSISNTTGAAFNVDTGTGNIDYDGTITQTNASPAVKINGKTAGMASFDGAVTANTATANGIDLTSNAGSTITFTGLLDIDTTTGTGFSATGGTLATLQVTNAGNTVDTVGTAALGQGIGVDISSGIGSLGVTFGSVNVGSAGKANSGILLANTGMGTFTVTGGTIQNTTTDGFEAANVTGTVSVGASIQNDGGRSVEITGSEGQFTFDGAIDDDAQGIRISSNNTGSPTFTFRGGIDIDTIGSNNGFHAFSGGTLNVCADTNCSAAGGTPVVNTVDTTAGSGTGVIIDLVTIGAEGVTFRSVSVDGATNGIVLDTTGTGSFEVTGDGADTSQGGNDSGGVIANTTGDGVLLDDADDVTLRRMTIGNTATTPAGGPTDASNIEKDGIDATDVDGLTLANLTIADTGDHGLNALRVTDLTAEDLLVLNTGGTAGDNPGPSGGQEEHGFNLDELRGDNFVRDSLFDAFNETGIELVNTGGTVDLTVDDTTFQDNKATVGNAGEEAILIEAQGTATIVALVTGTAGAGTNSIFDDISRQAIQAISLGTTSNLQLTVENSRFDETAAGDAVIIMNPDNSGSGNLTVKNNTFTDDTLGPFAVLAKNDSSGTLDATIQGNTVTNMQLLNVNHDNVGSGGAANGTTRVLVGGTVMSQGNNVTVGSNNIAVDLIASESPATGAAPDLSFTAQNNTTSQPDNNFSFTPGLRVDIQNVTRANLDITGNSFQGDPSTSGGSGIEVKELNTSVVGLDGFPGGNAAAAQGFIDTANPGSADASFVTSHDSNIGSGTPTLPTPTTLPNP